ncbi:HutD family protein [Streptomyces sp. BV286]|uniref:HutD/Ves family protein n=1 Tax=Streptomyces sp. BV286 TaxID=2849672 RepID=UPI001C2ECB45|nr:HutD family protein [Streptomyces sp. BV286]MBV1940424.1 HutD family protein [Streptomyces sp. BV286]
MGGDALRWSEYRSMPWKNRGGTTREVASGTVQAAMAPAEITDGFDWRVSVADVEAGGSFSAFPGIDRVITLVEGEGMVLTVDGTPHPVRPLSPFAFPGDAATVCQLKAGAVRNMNVMTRRSRATAHVRIITVAAAQGAELTCAANETLLVMAVAEGIAVDGPDGRETTLGRLDCVRHEGPAALTLRGEGAVAGIRIAAAG